MSRSGMVALLVCIGGAVSAQPAAAELVCTARRDDGKVDTYHINRGDGRVAPHIRWCLPPIGGQPLCLTGLIESDRASRDGETGEPLRVLMGDLDFGSGPAPFVIYLRRDRFSGSLTTSTSSSPIRGTCR